MSVHGRTDIQCQGTEQVTNLERSAGAILDAEGGAAAPGSKRTPGTTPIESGLAAYRRAYPQAFYYE